MKFPANGFLQEQPLKELAKLLATGEGQEDDMEMDVDDLDAVSCLIFFFCMSLFFHVCGMCSCMPYIRSKTWKIVHFFVVVFDFFNFLCILIFFLHPPPILPFSF